MWTGDVNTDRGSQGLGGWINAIFYNFVAFPGRWVLIAVKLILGYAEIIWFLRDKYSLTDGQKRISSLVVAVLLGAFVPSLAFGYPWQPVKLRSMQFQGLFVPTLLALMSPVRRVAVSGSRRRSDAPALSPPWGTLLPEPSEFVHG